MALMARLLPSSVSGCCGAMMLAATAFFPAAQAQEPTHAGHASSSVHFPVSCSAPAQRDFDQALVLLHHMTYPQARSAFAELASREPDCAMAHWGVAMTLFQPLWPTRPTPADLARGSCSPGIGRASR